MCAPVSNIPLLNGNESGSGEKPRPRLPAFSETGLASQGLEHCLVQKSADAHKLDTHTPTHTHTHTHKAEHQGHFTESPFHLAFFNGTKTDLKVSCLTKKPRENSA